MSWLYSQALVAEYLRANCSETELFAPLNSTPMPQAFSCNDKTTATYRRSRFGTTCGPLTAELGKALLTWFLAGSRAKTSVWQAPAMALKANGPAFGERWRAWFAKWSPASCEWRTPQCSLLADSESFSETWPRSGSMLNGTCFPRPTLAPLICVSGSGSLLPTLTVHGNYNAKGASKNSGDGLATALKKLPTLTAAAGRSGRRLQPRRPESQGMMLAEAIAMLPTLAARDYRSPNAKSYAERGGGTKGEQLPNSIGGPLNPDWCEWFMGHPIGWTASEPLETRRFQEWRQQHGKC